MNGNQDLLDSVLENLQHQLEIVVKALEGAKAEMDAAVLAEREACAKIAEETVYIDEAEDPTDYPKGWSAAANEIADKLRARGTR